MLGDIIPLDILSSIWSQCNSCDGGCSAGGITLFSVAIHECWVKLWSLHWVRASLTTVVLSQMQSPYMKRLCTACYRWYTLRTNQGGFLVASCLVTVANPLEILWNTFHSFNLCAQSPDLGKLAKGNAEMHGHPSWVHPFWVTSKKKN